MYKKISLSILAVVAIFSFNACGTVFSQLTAIGDKKITDPSIVNQLIEGKTSIADSEKILGTPQMLNHIGNNTELGYYFQHSTGVIGTGTETTNLKLTFDKNGILQKKDYYETSN